MYKFPVIYPGSRFVSEAYTAHAHAHAHGIQQLEECLGIYAPSAAA